MKFKQVLGILLIVIGLAQAIYAERIAEFCSQARSSEWWISYYPEWMLPYTKWILRFGGIFAVLVGVVSLFIE